MAAARNGMPSRVKTITAARADLALRVISDFETLLKASGQHDLMVYRETLRLFDNARQFEGEAEERAVKKTHGFACQTFTGDEAREMEPAISKRRQFLRPAVVCETHTTPCAPPRKRSMMQP